jgi:hypothetical protein
MKKIGFFILFLPALDAYWSGGNAVVDTPQDLSIIKAARFAQGINDLDHSQVLILLLVALIFVLLFGLAVFLIVWRLIRIGRAYRELVTSRWSDEPNTHWRKAEEPDLCLHMFTEQQWLLNQLLSQGYDDTDAHDFVDLPHDWWI